jgi:integrase
MPIYYDRTRKRWRYEFSRLIGGRRQRTTKLLPATWDRSKAEGYAREQDGHLYAVATGAVKEQPLISRAVRLYLEEHAPSLKNRAKLERDLAHLVSAYAGKRMNELAGICQKYAKDNAGLNPATIRVRLAYLRAACRWAWKRHNLGDHDPGERVTLPAVKNERHEYVSRAELLRILRPMANRSARAVCLVAFYSGMRLAEILRAEATPNGWSLRDTKNGQPRVVPIHPKTTHLRQFWPIGAASSTVQHCFKAAAVEAGFPDLRFHDLRHSSASAMVNAGVDTFTVGAILGHKSPQSTKRYTHRNTQTLASAIRKIG